MNDLIIEQTATIPEPTPLLTNDPDPVIIAIYAGAFLVAVIWNLFAYYKLFTLEHVKRELAIKQQLRAQGLLDPEDD